MFKKDPKSDKWTLTLRMSQEVKDLMEDLQKRIHAQSLVEVFRMALAWYDDAIEEHEKGGRVILESEGGKMSEMNLFPKSDLEIEDSLQ